MSQTTSATDAGPRVQETNPTQVETDTTAQLEVPGAQRPGLTSGFQPSSTLNKGGTFSTTSNGHSEEAKQKSANRARKGMKILQLSVAAILILIVWVLMFLPTVFFHVGKVGKHNAA